MEKSGYRWWAGAPRAVVASAVLGVLSAFGDWLWAGFIPDGAVLPGVVHGVVFFLLFGALLGWAAGFDRGGRRLLATLPLAGLMIAAGFYPVAYAVGYLAALLISWSAMWLALAFVGRWARGSAESVREAVLRAAVAAIGSGLAFWSISAIWTEPAPEPNYAVRALLWTYAFLPGLLSLVVGLGRADVRR